MSCGIDIVSNKRIGRILNLYGDRFIGRIFPEGIDYCFEKRKGEFIGCIASRFALKEATIKAFSRLDVNLSYRDILIKNGGRNMELFVKPFDENCKLEFSISHEREFSIAVVIVLGDLSPKY
ncbi:MAG: 4'-phosphopantetheinyl transferase superfamily protein [Nitrospiraceae bacterium]|nr:4'-phosphopantetheinyl transferase superfamily protein [Nitrospiraceae bacterium]